MAGIIEAKGGLVPDCKLRSGRRKPRGKRTREPEQRTEEELAVAEDELLRTHLREKVGGASRQAAARYARSRAAARFARILCRRMSVLK